MVFLLFTLVITSCVLVQCKKEDSDSGDDDHDLGNRLADALTNDANLDLPPDEEYEDLRAEFLAYRTALASLTAPDKDTRRSMLSTECWRQNGICINHKLCIGFKSISEVPGCKDKLKVCCLVWAKYNVRDHKDFGISNLAMPWSLQEDFGEGAGVVEKNITTTKRPRKKKSGRTHKNQPLVYIIRAIRA